MPRSLTRPATAVALALAVGLLALPACKKKGSATTVAAPDPAPVGPTVPGPTGVPNVPNTPSDGNAPKGPVFGTSDLRTAAARTTAKNNMIQIVLGLHNFHDVYTAFPAGYADKTGKPGLSWRVAILPFVEQDNLFKQFKLDEPWDSPANKKLIPLMPKLFAPPGVDTAGYTFTRGFAGPNAWLPPQPKAGTPGQLLLGVKIAQFVDGTSNTIVVAEAGDAVIWTKPDEMAFAPGKPPKLGGVFAGGAVVGLAGGEARFLRNGIDAKTLSDAIQINDGNVVNLDSWFDR